MLRIKQNQFPEVAVLAVTLPRKAAFPAASCSLSELHPLLCRGSSSRALGSCCWDDEDSCGTAQSSSHRLPPRGLLCPLCVSHPKGAEGYGAANSFGSSGGCRAKEGAELGELWALRTPSTRSLAACPPAARGRGRTKTSRGWLRPSSLFGFSVSALVLRTE